mgnify:CR=1 FL=1
MKDRTKVDISTALTTLLAKKAIDDITVREIVELCEIRRQTFYYHFQDKYDLINWYFDKICRLKSRTLSAGRIAECLSVCFRTG